MTKQTSRLCASFVTLGRCARSLARACTPCTLRPQDEALEGEAEEPKPKNWDVNS